VDKQHKVRTFMKYQQLRKPTQTVNFLS